MIRSEWHRLRGSARLATAMFLGFSALLVCGISAQSTVPALSGSSQSVTTSSSFLVAPSFSLGYAPSSVATGDLRQVGKLDLVTADYNSGKITVFLGAGQGNFASGAEYAAGPHPSFVVMADINGDGKPDVLVANETEGAISVLLGNGDGTLQALQSYAAGVNPSFIVTGDFNGNGKTDVAVAGKSGNQLAVLLNDGSGNLQKPILYSLLKTPAALAAADFNSDGHADLALANADGTVSILLGQGGGVFLPLPDFSAAASQLSSIVASDFNKDGKLDLAVTQANSTALTVLLGSGNGAFLPGVTYAVGNNPVDVIAADVNGDQVLDLIAVNQSANTFSVLLGNGDGSFATSVDFVAGNTPIAAVAGDFNGDGHMDLAIANSQDQSISLPLGKGDGTFQAARSYKAGLQRKAIAAGDLNGDGRSDLVVANFCGQDSSCSSNGSVAVFLASQDGSYTQASTYALGSGPVAVALADLNGDKKLDLLALNRNDKTLTVMPGIGDGTFGQAQSYTLANHPRALFVGDFNGDSKADLAIVSDCGQRACTQTGSLDIWLGNGDGTLTESTSYPVGYSPVSVTGGDLRGTGHIDLIVANACGEDSTCQSQGSASVFFGDGTAKFALSNEVNIGSAPSAIALGKLSGSGLNLVVAQRSSDQIAVLAGDGKGGFGTPAAYAVGSAPAALVVADLNGDGLDDVAVANFAASTVSVLNGSANGTLQPAVTYTVGTGPESIAAVKTSTGSVSSLVTANGNSGASPMGSDISLLTRVRPMIGVSSTSFTLTISPPSSSVDQQVTLTATATGSSGTPTGNVVFFYNGTPQVALADCNGTSGIPLDGAGTATCVTQLLPAGFSTPVEADYIGDYTYNLASATATPSVSQAATTTVVQSSNSNSNVNDPVTFTATISPSLYPMPFPVADVVPISGTVNFTDNGSSMGCDAQTATFNPANGTATANCVTSAVTAGVHSSIHAVYAGDTNYTSSTSSDLQQTVSALAATLGVTATPSSSTSVNDTVTFTVQLAAAHLTPVVPSGTVSFLVNGQPSPDCPSVSVNSSGQATCITNKLTAGLDSITATYAGDPNYTVAAPGTATQTVAKAGSTITVNSTPTPVSHWTADQPVTLTATVSPASGTAYVPYSGSVTFTDSAGSIAGCSSPVTVNASTGVASCIATALSAGSHAIFATYASDANYNGNTSSTLNNQVDKASTTTTLASSNTSSTVNDTVTFTATMAPSPVPSLSNELAISGTVAFYMDGSSTPISGCSAQTASYSASTGQATATCNTAALTAAGFPHSLTAIYAGDSNYNSSTTATYLSQTVLPLAATIGVTSSPSSSNVNDSVTFTAQLAGATMTPVVPSGTVSFTVNGNSSPDCPPKTVDASGKATCTTSRLVSPSDTIAANYTGDANFTVAAAGTATQTVSKATPIVALSSSGPSTVNNSVTLTATLSGAVTPVAPTGTISFTSNGNPIAGCFAQTVDATSHVATCSTSSLIAGSDSIGATYAGDSNFATSGATPISQSVSKQTPTVTVSSPGPSTVNDSVTFTATLTGTFTPLVPAGTVAFTLNGNPIAVCSAQTVDATTHQATCATNALIGGSNTIGATYAGDSNFATTDAAPFTQTVSKLTPTVTLTASPNPSTVNNPVTLTATLTGTFTPNDPSGTVSFTSNGNPITGCTAQAVDVTTHKATCTTSALVATSDTIGATYAGDSNFATAGASPITQTVNALAATLGVTASPSSSTNVNDTVTFTAQLAGVTMTPVVPSGTVSFAVNGTSSPDCPAKPVDASGKATCTTNRLVSPADAIVATYSGDVNFTVAAPGTATQTVSKTTPTVALASSGPSNVNNPVTLTATLSGAVTPVAPTGTVSFTSNGNPITGCTAQTVDANSHVASCTTSSLIAGSDSIGATYAGDSNFATAGATPITQSVSKQTPTVTVSSPGPSTVNDSVTFTATLSGTFTPLAPTGSVAFTLSGNPITGCTAQTVDATTHQATCATTALIAGSNTIGATYAGDSNFATASAAPFSQSVSKLTPTVTLSTSPSPSNVNDSVTLTATLSGTFTPNDPTGTVSFTSNGNPIASCTTQAVGATTHQATCVTSALVATSDTIGATYAGDSNFATAGASPIPQTVIALTATIGLTVSPSSSTYYGDTVTFTAQLSNATFTPVVPSGTVNFTTGGSSITGCSAVPVNATGKAICSTTSLTPGSDAIAATYSGDSNFTVSAPATATQTVTARTTTAAANASLYYSPGSQVVPLTATVTSSAGTVNAGTVTFTLLNGSTVIGAPVTSGAVTSGAAAASYTLPAGLNAGAYTIQAVYNAANYFVTSTDSAHALNVQMLTPVITWNTPATIIYGTALSTVQLNATASVPGNYVYTPAAGTVPAVGSNTLSVKFTPNDQVDYTTATATVTLQVNNPVPVMGSMSPVFTTAGGAAFPLAVTGSGFVANSTVYWGTTALATTYGSATQLTAQVPASLTATAGTAAITVQTPTPGGGASSSLQFEVDSAASASTTPPSFTTVTATVTAGASATYPVTLPSTATTTSVTCLNLPAGATCSYSATTKAVTITTSSTTPAGTYLITVVFSETLPGAATALVLLPILLLPLVIARRKWTAGSIGLMACLGFVLMVAAATIGCGGSAATHQVTSSGTVSLTIH
jgi:hypothetical protein